MHFKNAALGGKKMNRGQLFVLVDAKNANTHGINIQRTQRKKQTHTLSTLTVWE